MTTDISDTLPPNATAPDSPGRVTAAQRFAECIMQRLDALDQRLDTLAPANAPSNDAGSAEATDLTPIRQVLEQQSAAITCIASSVAELKNSLASGNASGSKEPDVAPAEAEPEDENAASADEAAPAEVADAWSQIRQAFLTEEAEPSSTAESTSSDGAEADANEGDEPPPQPAVSSPTAEAAVTVEKCEIPAEQIPRPVDCAKLSNEQLIAAVHERDEFATLLMHRLQARLLRAQPLTSDQLAEMAETLPDDLQTRVISTLKLMDTQARLGELELSLERAQLARKKSALQTAHEKLAASARVIGLTLNDDGNVVGEVNVAAKGTRGRQWLGAMGFGN
ncbi:hypothetical protein Fuma_01574 [Fuerstiella marisgermanici]|uniref:Uncharacterized protein n=2 Tax=Fuerstiella marisgermanici TaxID=1891926 RepID=A0A1P8WD33_9PLAN|nr:hypothetical protein Fuma_01574 [Fuerstiella marisgermanici]